MKSFEYGEGSLVGVPNHARPSQDLRCVSFD